MRGWHFFCRKSEAGPMSQLAAGDLAPPIDTISIRGDRVRIADPSARLVHLQFRRFAGCPICNLHLRELAARADELRAKGIREVVVFHSSQADMEPHQSALPFDCIADPGKALYRRYGVETSLLSVLHPAAMWAGLRGLLSTRRMSLTMENGVLGLPADFLIAPDGRIRAAHYGLHAYDNWDADTILDLAGRNVELTVSDPISPAA
jgi:peroxiredoxin